VRKAAICFLVLLVPLLLFVPSRVAAQESTDSAEDAQLTAVDGKRLDGESSETQVMFQAARYQPASWLTGVGADRSRYPSRGYRSG
jgi:hypothetical protein